MTTAQPSDWATEPLPEQQTRIALDRRFAPAAMARIRQGLIPQAMEDKWFVYWQHDALHFHRSWTGTCIYVAHFTCEGEICRMVAADVNRDPAQYTQTDDALDAQMINTLIDVLLLHREAPFPHEGAPAAKRTLRLWTWIGRALFDHHPNEE